eukprot:71665-Chlamydomonas_euryale.AAC.1
MRKLAVLGKEDAGGSAAKMRLAWSFGRVMMCGHRYVEERMCEGQRLQHAGAPAWTSTKSGVWGVWGRGCRGSAEEGMGERRQAGTGAGGVCGRPGYLQQQRAVSLGIHTTPLGGGRCKGTWEGPGVPGVSRAPARDMPDRGVAAQSVRQRNVWRHAGQRRGSTK